jgi:FkbM family methyltransferase
MRLRKAGRTVVAFIGLAAVLWLAGVSVWSIAAFPIRRRREPQRAALDLRNGISIQAPPDEPLPHIFLEIWGEQRYKLEGMSASRGDAIVDLGAHVGVFSLWAGTRFPRARIIAYEPASEIYKYLRRNVEGNRLQNVTTVNAACGAVPGGCQLYSRGPGAMNSFYRRDNYGSRFVPLERVKVVTLASIFEQHAIHRCALLKLDCEGAEYEILFSAPRSVTDKIQAIALEYHVGLNRHTPAELATFLELRGFEVDSQALLDKEGGYMYARRKNPAPPEASAPV